MYFVQRMGIKPGTFELELTCYAASSSLHVSISLLKKDEGSQLPACTGGVICLLARAESIFCNVGDREQTNNLWIRYASMLC